MFQGDVLVASGLQQAFALQAAFKLLCRVRSSQKACCSSKTTHEAIENQDSAGQLCKVGRISLSNDAKTAS